MLVELKVYCLRILEIRSKDIFLEISLYEFSGKC